MKEIFNFLTNLAANNNKEWFDVNKETYQQAMQKIGVITQLLVSEIRTFDPLVPLLEVKDCVYRIYRDVRFSKDKTPYKTYFGIHISRMKKQGGHPGYYFHIQPGESFISAGIYMPSGEFLKAIRDDIYYRAPEFIEIIENEDFKNNFSFFDNDKLKTNPKGYPADFAHIDLLRNKSFAPYTKLSDEQLLSEDILPRIVESYRKMYHVNKFLYEAIENVL
jgi:uncharacterized protein (TIGR02453 family)